MSRITKTPKKVSNTIFTVNADHPRPLVTVHFVSSKGTLQNIDKIPYNILLEYDYYVKKDKGYFTVEDEHGKKQELQSANHNRYYMNIKERKNIIEDSTVQRFGVKDRLTRIGYERDVRSGEYGNEFVKAINTKTNEYILVFRNDLNILDKEAVGKNFKIRAAITDSVNKEHMREIKLNNADWQKLDDNKKVDLVKLDNNAKNKDVVLEVETLPNLAKSRLGIDNLTQSRSGLDISNQSSVLPSIHHRNDGRDKTTKHNGRDKTTKTNRHDKTSLPSIYNGR